MSDHYLEPDEQLSDYEQRALAYLGWPAAEPGHNHQLRPEWPLSSYDLACRMLATLQLAFGCRPDTPCSLTVIRWRGQRPERRHAGLTGRHSRPERG